MVIVHTISQRDPYNFGELVIDTDSQMIAVFFKGNKRIVNLQQIYSAIKDAYMQNQELMAWPFPMTSIDTSNFVLNDDWVLMIEE